MKKIFPTDKRTNFLVADDVRQEISNKAIIIGYYSDNRIKFLDNNMEISKIQPLMLPSLNLLWVFTDGKGDFDMKAYIKDPNGVLTEIMSRKMNKNTDGATNLLLKMTPFIFHAFGEFESVIDLGEGHKYKRKFMINGH
ncbi:MAG: hypothetical protein ABL867_10605 [Rickettsiales bacterium]